jgi:outer membrane protein
MKKFWRSNTAFISLVLLTTGAFAQQKNELSIKQCVDYADKNAVAVKNALLDIQIQRQVNRQVTALAYPQINGSVGATHYFDIPVQSLPNFISPATYQVLVDEQVKNGSGNAITFPNGGNFGTIAAQFGVPWTASAGVDVSQILFDGQVFVGLKARSAVLDFAKKNAEVTQEQIKANIHKIYYQLVVGKQQIAALDANIERFEKLLFDTKEIYKNGFAEKLDVDKVTVQLNNIKTEKIKIENMLVAGNSGLKFIMGMPQKEELLLTDSLSEDELKANILNESYNYQDRKEIQLLSVAEKLGNYNIKRYKLSKIPTIAAFASYSKNAQRSSFNFFNKGEWFNTSLAGIKIAIPIFDGNRKNALIQQSRYELQKTKNNTEQLKQVIDYDVEQAKIKMTSALLTMDNQKKNIELAEKVFNTTKKKYEQGLGSNQEIYNAQTELKVAQTNYYSSLYDAISAKIDWLKAAGKL